MNKNSYEGMQLFRYERLRDAVLDYIEEGAVDEFFEDIRDVLKEGKEYHDKQIMHFDSVLCGLWHETEDSSDS